MVIACLPACLPGMPTGHIMKIDCAGTLLIGLLSAYSPLYLSVRLSFALADRTIAYIHIYISFSVRCLQYIGHRNSFEWYIHKYFALVGSDAHGMRGTRLDRLKTHARLAGIGDKLHSRGLKSARRTIYVRQQKLCDSSNSRRGQTAMSAHGR